MSSAWLSPLGLYYGDDTIFENMYVPEGVEKEVVVSSILWETAELEVLLTSPEAFKNAVTIWSRKRKTSWDRIWKALNIEYNPIENYRRNEQKALKRGKLSTQAQLTKNETEENYTPDNTDTLSRTGFNSGELQITDRNHHEGNDNTKNNSNSAVGTTNGESEGVNEGSLAFGNIGVTTTQKLLREELELAETNMIEIIVGEFKETFCLMVY